MRMKFCVVCYVLCVVEKWSITMAMAIESIALAAAAAAAAPARRCYNDAY